MAPTDKRARTRLATQIRKATGPLTAAAVEGQERAAEHEREQQVRPERVDVQPALAPVLGGDQLADRLGEVGEGLLGLALDDAVVVEPAAQRVELGQQVTGRG